MFKTFIVFFEKSLPVKFHYLFEKLSKCQTQFRDSWKEWCKSVTL